MVTGGRHPVVERALRRQGGGAFVANDCGLTKESTPAIWLLTGPNMAGKSTFLRQNALIALLAQAGSFVPATSAHVGLVSQLFSRVGASDDLARGRSTFMVEMVETAAILNQADDRAPVSYTHLDVYKRQGDARHFDRGFPAGGAAAQLSRRLCRGARRTGTGLGGHLNR